MKKLFKKDDNASVITNNSATASSSRERLANTILLGSGFLLMMGNWNFFSLYQKLDRWNPIILAVALIAILLLVCDIKSLIRDKFFWCVVAVNIIAFINLTVLGGSYYVLVPLFDLTMALFLIDKIHLSKAEIICSAIFVGIFFFYWTIDVKGFYKGYSINYGGLVLITGFIFVIFIVEWLRYVARTYVEGSVTWLNGSVARIIERIIIVLKTRPYIFTAIEVLLFLQAYNIISWYRSRTAFFGLVALGIMLLIPRDIISNKILYPITVALLILGGFLFPIIYVWFGRRVNAVDYQMFYKSLIDSRFQVWQDLFQIYKQFPLTGVGTIYTNNDIYRPGLLDTMNVNIDLLVAYGPIVCIFVLGILAVTLLRLREAVASNYFSRLTFIVASVMLIVSYGESMILSVPFMLIFMVSLIMIRSCVAVEESSCGLCNSDYKAIDIGYYKELLGTSFGIKLLASALVVLLPIILVYILGPVEIYYSNYDEFSFTNTDYIGLFGALAIILFIVGTTVLSLLPDKLHKVVCIIISAISAASYVQYMFLNKKLIMEDGEFVKAEDLGDYPIKTLCVYIAVAAVIIILGIVLRKVIYQFVSGVNGFLTAITVIATVSLFITHIGSSKESLWYSGVDQFKVAPGENVIVIVPDTFGRDALDSMLEVYPDGTDWLHDFTFFSKEDSEFFPTYPALHHMLTALPYDGTMTRFEYTKAGFESDTAKNFFGTLHDKDYTVRFYTNDILFENQTVGLVDNIEEAHITIDRKALFGLLYKMSMYRYVPYAMKAPYEVKSLEIDAINVYNGVGPHWLNSDFYPAMNEQGLSIDDSIENAFIMHHIRGAHMPYVSDADNNLVPDNSVPGSDTAYGTMKLIGEYLEHLKEIGKYDDSTIFVVADHGFYKTDSIFFMKKKGETHDEIVTDESPIKHADFQNIVLENIK